LAHLLFPRLGVEYLFTSLQVTQYETIFTNIPAETLHLQNLCKELKYDEMVLFKQLINEAQSVPFFCLIKFNL